MISLFLERKVTKVFQNSLRNAMLVQRFADLRWAGFLPPNFMRSTELSATTKLSAEHESPPIANVLFKRTPSVKRFVIIV